MKVLITGGHGRVGKYVIEELRKDHEILVFDIKEGPCSSHYRFFKGDLTNYGDILNAAKGVEAIIHLAAIPTDISDVDRITDIMEKNVVGTFNVLEAAAKNCIGTFIFSSSICAGGYIFWKKPFVPDYFPIDEKHPSKPDDMYGTSKLMGEIMCHAYSRRYGMSMVCLRLATVLFPDLYEKTQTIVRRHEDTSLGKDRLWNYVDVRDVAVAFRLALNKKDISYEIYNIGASDVLSNEKSIDLIKMYFPTTKEIRNNNGFLLERYGAIFDISKARKELGYNPKFNWREYLNSK